MYLVWNGESVPHLWGNCKIPPTQEKLDCTCIVFIGAGCYERKCPIWYNDILKNTVSGCHFLTRFPVMAYDDEEKTKKQSGPVTSRKSRREMQLLMRTSRDTWTSLSRALINDVVIRKQKEMSNSRLRKDERGFMGVSAFMRCPLMTETLLPSRDL